MKLVFCLLLSSFLIGCATQKKSPGKAYSLALEKAFSRMESQEKGRKLASFAERPREVERLLPRIKSLSTDFEVMVFPKITGQAFKYPNKKFSKLKWGFPLIYRFQKRRIGKCYSLATSKDKWRAFRYFTQNHFSSSSKRNCLVLEVKQAFPKILRSRIRKDDKIAMRIYLDDSLRPFGQEYEIARVPKARKSYGEVGTVGFKLNPFYPLDSGLSGFPVDLPNFISPVARKNWKKVLKGATKVPKHPFIVSQMKKFNVVHKMCEEGYRTHYKDLYGRKVRVGWCEGNAWPTTIETRRYFAVLRNGANSL